MVLRAAQRLDPCGIVRLEYIDGGTWEILMEEANNVKDPNLKDLLSFGFGIHRTDRSQEDPGLVKDLFDDEKVRQS
jgi:hypothetical protein